MTTRLPLFDWREQSRIERIEAERETLRQRILKLPKMSHRRIMLEARLCALTTKAIATEARHAASVDWVSS